MGKARRTRKAKPCSLCGESAEVLFRIKNQADKPWLFACKDCQIKQQRLEAYQYGGTWKSKKRN